VLVGTVLVGTVLVGTVLVLAEPGEVLVAVAVEVLVLQIVLSMPSVTREFGVTMVGVSVAGTDSMISTVVESIPSRWSLC